MKQKSPTLQPTKAQRGDYTKYKTTIKKGVLLYLIISHKGGDANILSNDLVQKSKYMKGF
ncbi:hypothetical protein GBL85_08115 [Streptococcus equi]|nr:hypothetical protein [Streptococcus equi]NBK69130.1 hypothetical protein [Streptococcus equi]NBK85318.1 hypothetical protein [Streptococcus equi]NBL22800.1 hypothetical protein [Streptococcus equi]NBL34308.1 hypothetical protein [Streptococcus equi]